MADEGEAKKTGWGTLGHQWITAIAALVTALTGAGFFVGRASAPNATPSPSPVTTTVTVTAMGSGDGRPAAPVTTAKQSTSDPSVYYAGAVTFGDINLDLNPPASAGESDILAAGDYLQATGGNLMRVWADSGNPGRDDCTTLAQSASDINVFSLHAGSIVCGLTAKNRPFRINVKVVTARGIVSDVVVWNK
ncbi:hypothetical protein AB0K15_19045 [Amycolatopsis sp. NPDC049253]|uniref:hypothetical protein n=1 Tax=Amycolatopsis sp. NPDC049253 TaxID=3155274 RepID=UPI0034491C7B